MAEEKQKTPEEKKLEASRLMRKAERRMLDDCRDKLRALSGALTSTGEGYLRLLSRTKQSIESQINLITTFLKERIKRLNSGWPNGEIRKAKADELRPGRKPQSEPEQKLDSNTLKILAQKDPRG